jgi:ferredoxin
MLAIDPDECIDCGVCVNECPVHAIYSEDEVPAKWRDYIELNARYSKEWPIIEETREPLGTADEFRDVKEKREHFSPNPAREV